MADKALATGTDQTPVTLPFALSPAQKGVDCMATLICDSSSLSIHLWIRLH